MREFGIDDVIANAEQSLTDYYRSTDIEVRMEFLTFRGVRNFLDNLRSSPQFGLISVDGLLVHERIDEIRVKLGEAYDSAPTLVEFDVRLSQSDLELLLRLVSSSELKKYKRDTASALTAKVKALVRQHTSKAKEKEIVE